ncbi:sporulation integral membrane protein YtvI [Alicyclobacillus dauci]|uniref:Sporulation integral membrane protein YtvI n=1 Tax=Alicyclobacillus dauci TaxID=1475485 RepID=A0ABY6Z2R9_9BACL|nr:sporulation integral membrane protein YtvI [Alicyclobacillus dauci]WAH36584.1 sporulation integral membrane protein YtvI [Alicyclobacillus dauci]
MRATRHQLELRRYYWRVLEVFLMLAFIVVFALLLGFLMKYILPFVIGWIFAILLIPIVRWMEHRSIPRLTAVLIVLVCTVALVLAVSAGIVIGTAREASAFLVNSQAFVHVESNFIQEKLVATQVLYGQLPTQLSNQIDTTLQQFARGIEASVSRFVSSVLGSFAHLPETLFVGVIGVVTTFFILLRRERMMKSFFRIVPPGWDKKLNSILSDMSRAFLGTIRVQFILMCMSAVLGVIGMYVLGIPYAVLLGILFALTGLVPMLGSALLTVPWAIGALLLGDVSMAIKVIGLQLVISLIRHMVEPKILAESVGLDTLSTLFALYVGLKLIGVVGLFIGPILLIGAKGLLRTHLFVDLLPHFTEVEDESRGGAGS